MQNYSVKCKIHAKIVRVGRKQWLIHKKVKHGFCAEKTFLNSFLFQTVWVKIELEEVLTAKDLWRRLRVRTHLQTQLATQKSSLEKKQPLIGTVDSWFQSDWFTYWVTWLCRESDGGQASGVSVRGQGSNQGRTLCADTYESCSDSRTRLPFPSPQPILIISRHKEDGNALRRERALQHEGREERRPLGRFWDAVLSQTGLQGWGRWM